MKNRLPGSNFSSLSREWDSGVKLYEGCPLLADKKTVIFLPYSLKILSRLLSTLRTEWLLYMKAFEAEEGALIAAPSYCVPRQKATAASVEVLDASKCSDYNVAVHRHPEGIDDFSATDMESIVANNDINILVVGSRVAKAVERVRLPCGHFGLAELEYSFYYDRAARERASRVASEVRSAIVSPPVPRARRKLEESYVDYYSYYGLL